MPTFIQKLVATRGRHIFVQRSTRLNPVFRDRYPERQANLRAVVDGLMPFEHVPKVKLTGEETVRLTPSW